MKIKVFEAFAGYGSQAMALKRLAHDYADFDYEVVGISEIEETALTAYNAVHGHCPNFGDISTIDWNEIPDFDLFTYSFPCFPAGTLVLSERGYIPIEEVKKGDKVLTHNNRFMTVITPMRKQYSGKIYRFNAMCIDRLTCTEEHPFYVRKKHSLHNKKRVFDKPCWVKAKNIDNSYYFGYAINQESLLPNWGGVPDNRWGHNRVCNKLCSLFENSNFWYLMGRYVGDGWKKNSSTGNGIVICCSSRNRDSLLQAITDIGLHYSISEERTATKVIICSNELNKFVDRYGYMAYGKYVDYETLSLPTHLLASFVDGIMDSDGCITQGLHKVTTVSRTLAYGLAQCVAKVYKRPFSIYYTKRNPKVVIEGRICNQRDTYSLTWKTENSKSDKSFYEDGYIWFPIRKIECMDAELEVFNMSVETDESYTANGVICHNCTDISNAGEQAGLTEGSGTRSSLLWECRKAIEIKRPKYLLMENVPALVGKKFLPQLQKWQAELEAYGYTNFTKTLNAKDFGTPQNRNRVFMVSILGDANFEFPQPFELTCRLKDVLETVVDEKYYISEEKMQAMLTGDGGCKFNKRLQEMLLNRMIPNADGVYIDTYNKTTNTDVCGTIKTTVDSVNMTYTTVLKVGDYSPSGHNASSVVSPDGIAPTVMENHGTVTAVIVDDTYANREPKVVNPLKGQTKYGWHFEQGVYDENGIARALKAGGGSGNIPKVMQIGNLYPDTDKFKNRTMGRVYSTDGISPTINCCSGGDREPKILECEFFGFGRSRDKKGNVVSRHLNDYVNCIHAQVGSARDNMQVLVAQSIPFRIRKLTPKECFRLMDVTDEDIAKIQNTGVSNSKQYKLAGNSICVNVLYFTMEQMFRLKDITTTEQQLTLF